MRFIKPAKKHLKIFSLILIIFLLGVGFGNFFVTQNELSQNVEKNAPSAFLGEVYEKISKNYWDNISDTQLIDLFKLASQKEGLMLPAKINNKDSLISQILDSNPDPKKIANIVGTVLASLQPAGRSGLYTEKQEVELKNVVENRNPETGVVEPTIFTEVISPGILYMQFKKFSPTSYEEFIKGFESHKDFNLNALIFDLRGNVGGAIDATSYFLGHFLGKDQYAFDFYHKGVYEPFKTPTEKLPSISRFKQIVVLVDQNTQSSAEMMAASLKKYHIGVLVGVPTKGWGTVERVFPLDNQISQEEKYSLFLVHSITLRDDNLPIEGRGVEPNINITSSNWQDQLFSYFRNQVLINTVKDVL